MKYTVHPELGSVADLHKRFKAAKGRKQPWIELLRECYEYALPQRETFYAHFQGEDRQREIYDSTAQVAVNRFVSRMQSILVPPWREWTKFVPGPDIPADQREDVELQRAFEEQTEIFFNHINHSNFITECAEAFGDLGTGGTGALYLGEGSGDKLLDFQSVPLSELVLEEGPWGTVETVWREHEVPVRVIERMYPGAELGEKLGKLAEKSPDKKVTIVEGTVYAPKANIYQTVVTQDKSDHVIFAAEYEVSPWIVFRWSTTAGEIYGRSPVMTVLPDIKTANVVKEFILRNAALNVGGIYTAEDDGVLNPYSIEIAPNTIIPVSSNDSGRPTLRALERSGDPQLAQFVLTDLQNNIKEGLFNSMRTAEGPVKSATEIAIDNRELVEQINSSFGRLQTEFIEKLVNRAVFILARAGKMAPIEVDGREVTLKHTSPLAQAQDQADLINVQAYIEAMSALGPELMMLNVNVENAGEVIGRMLGVDPDMIRSKDEKEQAQKMVADKLTQMGGGLGAIGEVAGE